MSWLFFCGFDTEKYSLLRRKSERMKKNYKIEAQKNQLLYQFLERLNEQLPKKEFQEKMEDICIQQYQLLVNMSFSANILFKGVGYANQLYNHIVKIEYTRVCQSIIKQNFDRQLTEELLKKLKHAQRDLLFHSPSKKQSEGIAIFYGFTGGNRKKYKANRKAIRQMYLEIKLESEKSFYRYIKETIQRKYQKMKEKKIYAMWLLKSQIWH